MDGTTKLWLWIGCIGMTIGAVIFGSKAASMRKKEGMEFPLESFFITLVAATMYLTMALGETVTPVKGQEVFKGTLYRLVYYYSPTFARTWRNSWVTPEIDYRRNRGRSVHDLDWYDSRL